MNKKKNNVFKWGISLFLSTICLINEAPSTIVEATKGVSHIGTFNGSTTFRTSSSNGINPGLFIEVMDGYGRLTQYESGDGVITIPDTKEGAYVTQAKLLGKTKYRDLDTNEILDSWEEGRNLELVSVENPKLKTIGKNLFKPLTEFDATYNKVESEVEITDNLIMFKSPTAEYRNQHFYWIDVKPNTEYVLSMDANLHIVRAAGIYDSFLSRHENNAVIATTTGSTTTFTSRSDKVTVRLSNGTRLNEDVVLSNLQLEEGSTATTYEPYKENTITFDEEITLRGIGDVQDELNLMTGEVVGKIGEVVLDGDENWKDGELIGSTMRFEVFAPTHGILTSSVGLCDRLPFIRWNNQDIEHIRIDGTTPYGQVVIWIETNKLSTMNANGLKQWLASNPIKVQFQMSENFVKVINLSNTYTFPSVKQQSVAVNGTVSTTIGSITVPTEPLSFALNPNLEGGQQFVAPEFTVLNDNHAPITLGIKSFEQITDVLNDVLPDKYDSWEGLNKTESKDIALALVPKHSDGWINLTEKPYYVTNTTNETIGQIKGNSSVDFSFEALHGQAFSEVLTPQYQLTFVFEF